MKHPIICYFAGGFKGELRAQIKSLLERYFIVIDPGQNGSTDPADYTEWDLAAIEKSDIVVGFMEKSNPSGFPLCAELGFALGCEKQTVFLDFLDDDPRSRYFDFIRYLNKDNHFVTVREFENYLKDNFGCA